jgi:hypothetical protein
MLAAALLLAEQVADLGEQRSPGDRQRSEAADQDVGTELKVLQWDGQFESRKTPG